MPKYLALLRGINVSGHNLIRMQALREFFVALNFTEVQTYIQSGNIVFSSKKKNHKELEGILEKEFQKYFGYAVPILVLNEEEVKKAINTTPFQDGLQESQSKIYYIFLKEEVIPEKKSQLEQSAYEFERFKLYKNYVYLECFKGMGKAKFNTSRIEKILDVSATARNQRTMMKLYELLKV
ncbi:DUF1697 domain-containing protein [Eudoraea chungangensis]|uniref:DUF1697 domain-containing protein n=1 Tax=Eudoraea chungangensis TaxID=1481905 RepID=UPI0023EBD7D0|nr:DUF1697 domain-containing protein [Eudoraea chungangensis]